MKILSSSNPDFKLNNIPKWDSGIYKGVNIKDGKQFGLEFSILPLERNFMLRRVRVIAP